MLETQDYFSTVVKGNSLYNTQYIRLSGDKDQRKDDVQVPKQWIGYKILKISCDEM